MLVQSVMIVVESFVSAEETWAEWSRGVVAVGVGAGVAVGRVRKGAGGGWLGEFGKEQGFGFAWLWVVGGGFP